MLLLLLLPHPSGMRVKEASNIGSIIDLSKPKLGMCLAITLGASRQLYLCVCVVDVVGR